MTPILLVHGGAGDVPDERVEVKLAGVKKSVGIGYRILENGGSALDAVEAAVRCMEDDDAFNSGRGSCLNQDGEVEMDASIMNGVNLSSGAVAVVKDIAHPISLARLVMEKTPHILIAGAGANRFAKEQGVPTLPPGSLVTKYEMESLRQIKEERHKTPEGGGTVGAVAIDAKGNLAAATSTGGNKWENGHGETIARYCLAHSITKEMEYGKSAQQATEGCLKKMTERLKNTAGAITISGKGDVGIYFTTDRMSWAFRKGNELHYGVEQDQHILE
ncbi:hypothetical protein NQ315_012010 [Exocentrus adspersus]|uniref:Uncharacterized protein n=1 Tax=Exocentrus adspersus TaxID=1586481 RepID=A0AAV8W158_9CUCU|nr:hypothetical protein NQ315_012010 [Exocentrus adspersus]